MSRRKTGCSKKTAAIRALEQRDVPYTPCPMAHGSLTAEGVARELDLPVAKVVKSMIVKDSKNAYHLFITIGIRILWVGGWSNCVMRPVTMSLASMGVIVAMYALTPSCIS